MAGKLTKEEEELLERFLQFCSSSSDERGVNDDQVKMELGQAVFNKLGPVLNHLLSKNRMQLRQSGDGSLWYKILEKQLALKFDKLGNEQMMVYQVIEKAGNRGIWTRDIKNQTNIQQQTLTKSLKTLETRQLIKSVKSVTSKSKKLYMLYDLEPSKEITGGPWYTEQEFDREFIDTLKEFVVLFIDNQTKDNANYKGATVASIAENLTESQLSKVTLSADDVSLIVNSLVYDLKLIMRDVGGVAYYSRRDDFDPVNSLTQFPCGNCRVSKHCSENGVINPVDCSYLKQWLEKAGTDDDEEHGDVAISGMDEG